MKIGFVGLGTMGFHMARHLIDRGHELTCSSRSPGPAARLAVLGARAMSYPSEVVMASEVTFLCLPDDDAVRTVVTECLEVVAGRVLVDCSTVGPETERDLASLVESSGGDYLDAPVSGGPTGAEAGTLATMVGGDPAAFTRARPAIEAFAGYVDLVGGVGAGQVVKLCNQVIVGAQMLALAECARLVESSGVDATRLHDALRHSTGDCVMGRIRFPVPGVVATSPASNDWRPDFTTALMAKDLRLADEYAREIGVPLHCGGIKHLLTDVPGWVDAIGSRVIEHLPSPGTCYRPGTHPVVAFPQAHIYRNPYCRLGHWKHQLFRVRSPGDVTPLPGQHTILCADGRQSREWSQDILMHHVPLRGYDRTAAKLRRAAAPGGRYATSPDTFTRWRLHQRLTTLDLLFEGRRDLVPNGFPGSPMTGVHLVDWRNLVQPEERELSPLD